MRVAALLLTMGAICAQELPAQGPVGAGQHVRITSARFNLDRTVGRVVAAGTDTMTIAVENGETHDTLVVAFRDLQGLEVGDGTHKPHATKVGATVGAVFGLALGMATMGSCNSDDVGIPCAAQPIIGGVIFAGAGALVGKLIDATSPAEQWTNVPLKPSVSIRSLRSGKLGVGLAVHF